MTTWSDDQKEQVADALLGTCMSISEACEKCGVPEIEDMEDVLLDTGIEHCTECGWWDESTRFNEYGICAECQEDYEGDVDDD